MSANDKHQTGGPFRSSKPERMFTFRCSSSKPTFRVRCHNCDWKTSGNSPDTYKRADAHECPAAGLPETKRSGE